jgi:hypothetical protein
MRTHKFHPGQVMNVTSGAMQPVPAGRYEIVRGLPERDSELQYRVKSLTDGSEWVIKESCLG